MKVPFKEVESRVNDERKSVTREISKRYQKSTKKEKGLMLNEFTALTGYNRNYASYQFSKVVHVMLLFRNLYEVTGF